MNDFKYTKDGKKVVVIGFLNKREIIVQEIFVKDDGAEIPAGENFIVTALLDDPIKSWKEKEIKKIDDIFAKNKATREAELKRLRNDHDFMVNALKEKIKAIKDLTNIEDYSWVDEVSNILSGEYKFVFDGSKIMTFDEYLTNAETGGFNNRNPEGFKALELFNYSNRTHGEKGSSFKVGSPDVKYARAYDDALLLAKEEVERESKVFLSNKENYWRLNNLSKIEGIVIPFDAFELNKSNEIEALGKAIKNKESELDALRLKLSNVKKSKNTNAVIPQ